MNEVDRQVLEGLTGAERIKALLRRAGFESYREFGIAAGRSIEEVSMCLNGRRPYGEIRDQLAEKLGLSRDEIDRIIDGEQQAMSA